MNTRTHRRNGTALAARPRNVAETVDEANRYIRDIVAISTMPAVWLGANPIRIAESLLAALDTTIEPALGFLRLTPNAGEPPVEVAHVGRHAVRGAEAAISPQITGWASAHDPDDLLPLHVEGAAGVLRVCAYPLGLNAVHGVLAAGFERDPTPFQRTLLNIAANQANIACRNLALQHRQKVLYEQAQREIAEREKTERALRESEQFNRRLIESSRDCIKLLGLDARLLWLSEVGCKAFGVSDSSAVIGRSWIDVWNEAERPAARRAFAEAVAGGTGDFTGCFPVAGELRWWHVVLSPIPDAQGKPERILGVSRDITEHRRAEEGLQSSHAELRTHTEELERFNRAAVDRELRMIELKEEVNELRAQFGLARRYPLQFESPSQETHAEVARG